MSIMQKAARAAEAQTASLTQLRPEDSQSSTLVAVDPILHRVRGLFAAVSQFAEQANDHDGRTLRMKRILDMVVEEALDELQDRGTDYLARFMIPFADLMKWSVTGDYSTLPEMLIPLACQIDGIDPATFAREKCYQSEIGVMIHGPGCTHDDDALIKRAELTTGQ